jgi:methionyl aminopeptidase
MTIHIKNQQEIESMKRGGIILGKILQTLVDELKPGMTTNDLDKRAEALMAEYGVIPGCKGYHGYPAVLCTSVNNEVVHSIPNDIPLEKGDIISIDCVIILDELNTDMAVVTAVGGETLPEAQRFIDTCIRAMWAGIKQVKPGNTIGDIGYAIEKVTREQGFSIFKDLTGHGIGYQMHEEPHVYNYGKRGKGPVLKPGMTLAIEPIIGMGQSNMHTLDDGWTILTDDGSLAAQHEHTVLITESGYEVLTLRPGEKDPNK